MMKKTIPAENHFFGAVWLMLLGINALDILRANPLYPSVTIPLFFFWNARVYPAPVSASVSVSAEPPMPWKSRDPSQYW